jgi:4-amino-4-deoxy-L-arabinose transferase-like glycosyltransferase
VIERPDTDRKTVWPARAALGAILGLAAFLRLWHLDQNGYGRQYYAAGVRSMMDSAHAFFYNAFDPAAFLSIDKPPVALWMQVLSARLLGFSAFSVMLTQVVLGVLSVWMLHRLVARPFGRGAALVAALCLALTPISVAVDRSNNTESALTLVLLLAAWALLRATEAASGRLLVLAMALIGVGFNVKMAAALILAPTFFLVYFLGASGLTVRRRLGHLASSGLVMVAVSLSWMTFYDLTPGDQRPYAGSTQHNSMTELMLVHNGLSRFMPRAPQPPAGPAGLNDDGFITAADLGLPEVSAAKPQWRAAPLWDQSATGPLRLVSPFHAAQMGWWLPWAVAAVVLGAAGWRRGAALTPAQSSLLLWGGWVLSYGAVFSFASGVFHTYYLHVMGPPLGALAGIGWAALRRPREGGWRHGLSVTLLVTAAWLFYIERGTLDGGPTWHTALLALSMIGLLAAAVGTMVLSPHLRSGPVARALATTGLVASPAAAPRPGR